MALGELGARYIDRIRSLLGRLERTELADIQSFAADIAALSLEADVDRIARRVIDLLGEKVVRDVAWEVVPDLAEVILKARIRELEASVE